jgi:hypothetical protein
VYKTTSSGAKPDTKQEVSISISNVSNNSGSVVNQMRIPSSISADGRIDIGHVDSTTPISLEQRQIGRP